MGSSRYARINLVDFLEKIESKKVFRKLKKNGIVPLQQVDFEFNGPDKKLVHNVLDLFGNDVLRDLGNIVQNFPRDWYHHSKCSAYWKSESGIKKTQIRKEGIISGSEFRELNPKEERAFFVLSTYLKPYHVSVDLDPFYQRFLLGNKGKRSSSGLTYAAFSGDVEVGDFSLKLRLNKPEVHFR
ncbi:hypothetical protein HOD29_04180 [archaeon]|jgi:hypothetical protein|nr:hypothetical protein [archaeon]